MQVVSERTDMIIYRVKHGIPSYLHMDVHVVQLRQIM
jgi:hypothetical protein